MSNPEDYWIGWICAISTEHVAATLFLDEEHPPPATVAMNDNNTYQLGRIGQHNVVIAVLPDGEYGIASASTVATNMLRTFENIRVGLMVGIGGGAPTTKADIRLGDIVVSSPSNGYPGVFQYNFGKAIQDREFETTKHLDQPPEVVRTAIQSLKTAHKIHGHRFNETIDEILQQSRRQVREEFSRPTAKDRLYQSDYVHQAAPETKARCVDICGEDPMTLVERSDRSEDDDNPAIHYGLIASADFLIKDATVRDFLSERHGVLCFEMEAGGLMNHFPCLVIRGICDYSDTHKNKEWQGFAAMTAAAFAKDLLLKIIPKSVENEKRLNDVLKTIANDIRDTRREIQEVSSSLRTAGEESKIRGIYKWLSPPPASENHDRALSMRQKGSGLWFIQGREFQEWKNTQQSFLWLHGIPGCGKTVLCSSAIEDVQRSQSDSTLVLYFYFDFSNFRKTSPEDMIKSLVDQLYHQRANSRKPLDELWGLCISHQPSFEELCSTFRKMLELIGGAHILLDALDECREELRPNLLSWLENIRELPINLLVTSRAEHDISSALRGSRHQGQVVDIRSTLVTKDIRAYIRWRIKPKKSKESLSIAHGFERWQGNTVVQGEIETKLMEKANGMFRWVKCQLDTLERCLHYPALIKALHSLPRDLHDTYARILDNLDNLKKPWTIRILQFLAYSKRPLELDEIVDALAVDPDAEEQDLLKNRMPVPNEIAGYASTLVTLVVRETRKGTVEELQLAHFSVKEYLTSAKDHKAQFEEAHAKSDMTNVCLRYLLHLREPMSVKYIRATFPFAQFCARYWMEYAAVAETRDETAEKIQKLANKFLTCKDSSFTHCYRLYDPDRPYSNRPNNDEKEPAPALYYTSLQGLPISTKFLLDRKADVNTEAGLCGTALQAASHNGHREIAQQLLEWGADINAEAGHFGTALQTASEGGHVEVVRLLLTWGANINAKGEDHSPALYKASLNGHVELVRLLLTWEPNINAEEGPFGTALRAASSNGHVEVVRLLLTQGADVHAGGIDADTALQAASRNGHVEVVRLLLTRGADVNAWQHSISALWLASREGKEDVVELLIDKGADVHFCHRTFGNALYVASEWGHASIVEVLLRHNVDPNVPGCLFNSALQAALCEGHVQVAFLLFQEGFELDGKEDQDWRQIESAMTRAYAEAVHMLVENIANHGDGGPHPIEDILSAISVGFQTVSDVIDKERILEPFEDIGMWRRSNETTRDTLIACIDGNIGI